MADGIVDPDRALVLAYASTDRRAALTALFRLDEALGQIVRGARDQLLGQMRLTWWHEALSEVGVGPLPPDPVLAGLVTSKVVPGVVPGAALAQMIDGWEALLEEPVDLTLFARQRGETLFRTGAAILGGSHDAVADAGIGWALVDLARHSSQPQLASLSMTSAVPHLGRAMASRWPVALRSLGALAALASRDAAHGAAAIEPAGHPARMLRALRHRLTGR